MADEQVVTGNPVEEPQSGVETVVVEEEVVEEGVVEPAKKEEERFLDPDEIPKELLPHFKRMQASFTRRMQGLAQDREKVELYNKLMSNPETTIQTLASKMGLTLTRPGHQKEGVTEESVDGDSDTVKWIRTLIQKELGKATQPLKAEQATMKAQQTINYLDKNYPDWYLYEDIMSELVKKHPSLKDDADNLYELSKSAASRVGQIKKEALKKTQVITKPSTGGRSVTAPKKAVTIDEAFEIAKKMHGMGS